MNSLSIAFFAVTAFPFHDLRLNLPFYSDCSSKTTAAVTGCHSNHESGTHVDLKSIHGAWKQVDCHSLCCIGFTVFHNPGWEDRATLRSLNQDPCYYTMAHTTIDFTVGNSHQRRLACVEGRMLLHLRPSFAMQLGLCYILAS